MWYANISAVLEGKMTILQKFSIHVEELSNGQWGPYKCDDMQLSFVRIDPFVRQKLKHDNSALNG